MTPTTKNNWGKIDKINLYMEVPPPKKINLEMRGNGWMLVPWIKVGSSRKQRGLEENITYWLGNVKSQVPLRQERRMSTWLLGISSRAQR